MEKSEVMKKIDLLQKSNDIIFYLRSKFICAWNRKRRNAMDRWFHILFEFDGNERELPIIHAVYLVCSLGIVITISNRLFFTIGERVRRGN